MLDSEQGPCGSARFIRGEKEERELQEPQILLTMLERFKFRSKVRQTLDRPNFGPPKKTPPPPKNRRNAFCLCTGPSVSKVRGTKEAAWAPPAPQHGHSAPQRCHSACGAPELRRRQQRQQTPLLICHWDQTGAKLPASDTKPETKIPAQSHLRARNIFHLARAKRVTLCWRFRN